MISPLSMAAASTIDHAAKAVRLSCIPTVRELQRGCTTTTLTGRCNFYVGLWLRNSALRVELAIKVDSTTAGQHPW